MSHCRLRRSAAWFARILGIHLLVVLLAHSALAADRFAAWTVDGRVLGAQRMAPWNTPALAFRLPTDDAPGGKSLRLVRDRNAKVGLQAPFLLLANGDVLTGSPVELEPDLGRQGIVPRVRVQLEGMLPVSGTGVAVRTDRITRIVGSAEAPLRQQPPPGTVELADGRRFVARAIKWRPYGLAVLTAEGIIEANYPDIVDAVFPGIDQAAAVLDDNIWAGGSPAGTLVRFQLTSGATITASRISREQERSRRRGRSVGVEVATYYYVQPAWADQPLALPDKDIAWCGYRAADEAPLALLPAELVTSERLVGSGRVWSRLAGSDQGLPASGQWEADLALRTHSHSEIAFDLPPGAKSLTAAVGLDRAVGAGGCVRCLIRADEPSGMTLWDSGLLQGSDGPKSTGPLDVVGFRRVILITEFAHEDRPAGADPLDIRDDVVWLAPLITLDLKRATHLPAVLSGLENWEMAGSGLASAQLNSLWNVRSQSWDAVLALPKDSEVKLTRELRVTHATDVLELRTACPDELDEHDFQLTVNGQGVGWFASNDRAELRKWLQNYGRQRVRDEDDEAAMSDRLAYWWDLQAWRGQDVKLELVLRGRRERNEITWRGFSIRSAVANLPEGGQPLAFDVPLTSLAALDVRTGRSRGAPVKNGLPTGRQPQPIRFLGQQFTGGYGLPRDTAISFAIEPQFKRFVAIAGCANQAIGPLAVLIDGKVVWEQRLMTSLAPAEQIDVPIPAGAQRLTLQTGDTGSYAGYAAWASAGFVDKQ